MANEKHKNGRKGVKKRRVFLTPMIEIPKDKRGMEKT